ncbi:MAG: hypothetical protein R3E96_00620 [Planctomycetota bacterium]
MSAYKNKRFKNKPFQKRAPKKAQGPQPLHIDYSSLPADLDEEAIEELVANLPSARAAPNPNRPTTTISWA